jgi:Zn-finger nucleic acid-binding protein
MKCPVCSDRDLLMTDRQGVEIDYCPQCRGVWLDRGELDKIIERSAAGQPPRAAEPRYPEPPRKDARDHEYREDKHHGHGKHHSKKSLLGELFDF